jgi:4-hydroxy-tetrahydrodipicolinate synthase
MLSSGRHVSRLTGFAPTLPTPFDDSGDIDRPAFEWLCDRQVAERATALVVGETTGEAPTLSPGEHVELIHIASEGSHGASRSSAAPARIRPNMPSN